ncbi:chemotaxis response regulator protein-glutamate methylesterase [Malaciobacter canalis]|uniref:Protein-glutamate methylesterase/protein-glutamine glutaminase n=1 Tax=Malaciobacter canalis TaxID=1912871 RepID=A0ABX4LN48_9BACT|nr:chemotaxis-specific protein-glutamate methyltransferase CheB [Malaciobacter canalis]PHO08965.1 chemotaxis response regulator protein-glutamate methylesterase [Malaciobacter canalis]QEE32737.1 MCP protein-glutamate methylesterase (signal receiver domain) [Malaciobacter canalis]
MAKSILIVDDSALIRKQLGQTLDRAGYDIGFAKNGQDAIEFVKEFDFDAITMDINMPILDGVSAVKKIMEINPTPILMVSSLTSEDADITFEALDAGAIDFILKPGTISLKLEESEEDILSKIKAVTQIPKNRLRIRKEATTRKINLSKTNMEESKAIIQAKGSKPDGLVLIGSSTGGPSHIEEIVNNIPANYPFAILVIQHMPENFTNGFANRLNNYSNLNVQESKVGDIIHKGNIVIAKGGYHMTLAKKASGSLIIKHQEKNHRFFTPSIDELFLSASKVYDCSKIMAIELTGIGDDGAQGMLELRQKGAYTLAEDETTSVVYGMPKACWENKAALKKLPFPKIIDEILAFPNKFNKED